jgi:D-alanyl-D-alanine carboxypeptidase
VRIKAFGLAAASRFFARAFVSLTVAATLVSTTSAQAATSKYAAIVIDVNSGKTMFAASADAPRYPASLTKMMTIYMLFEGLKSGKFSKKTPMPVSAHAASQAPSKLGLKRGQSITVENAILALVTKSANDAAAVSGEFMGGSEDRFAQMMTSKARRLGMSRTTFRNASGLPNPRQLTTARDMATLGMALRAHFPEYYAYFSTRSFTYGRSRMGNHNKLLGRVAGVDGIKTGYTRASGFNLVTSVSSGNRRLVAVVMGGASGRARDQHMASLVKKYTPKASSVSTSSLMARLLGKKGKPIPAPVVEEPVAEVEVAAAPEIIEAPANVPTPAEKRIEESNEPALAYAAPLPVKRPAVAIQSVTEQAAEDEDQAEEQVAEEPAAEAVDPIVTASKGDAPSGWVIQIAAADSEAGARKLLSNAKSKGGKALSNAEPFTQAVEKGAATLYRARFSGFENKQVAWNACAALKKQKISCYALTN